MFCNEERTPLEREGAMNWKGLPLLIFGTSGNSKEIKTIVDEINQTNYVNVYDFLGFVSEQGTDIGKKVGKSVVVCSDENFGEYIESFSVIGIIIPIGTPEIKRRIYKRICKHSNLVFPNIISPSARIMENSSVQIGMGNIICSGCVLTVEIDIGDFNLINRSSTIGHNVRIGNYNIINPLVSVSGGVEIHDEVLVGAGSSIKQGVILKSNSIVGMGAIIPKTVEENTIMICQAAHKK